MDVWIAIALISLAVVSGVWISMRGVAPVDRRGDGLRPALEARLGEIERDRANGLLNEGEAKLARAEIGRRLLRLADQQDRGASQNLTTPSGANAVILTGSLLFMPVAALGLYFWLGQPGYSDQPMFARVTADPAQQSVGELLTRVEKHLAENPEDVQGWALLAPVYRRLERHDDAVHAWAQVLRFAKLSDAERAGVLADVLETRIMQAGGVVNEQAMATAERSLALDPTNAKAGYYRALGVEQTGDRGAAQQAWQKLLDLHRGSTAAWLPAVRKRLAALSDEPPPGPTREDVEAAATLDADDRLAMIRGMVDSLAGKLKDNPDNKDGWLRLIRSQSVLGEAEAARASLEIARKTFQPGTEARRELDALAASLKLGEPSQ